MTLYQENVQNQERLRTPTGCPVSGMAAGFDPFQDAFQTAPGASLAEARREEPVFYNPMLDYWVVTRYDDVRQILRDNDTFSASITLDPLVPLHYEAVEILVRHRFNPGISLVNEDPPSHPPHRAAHQEPFKGRSVERLAPRMREVVTEHIDRFVAKGHADLVAGLFHPVPSTIALLFMGIPEEDIDACRRFALNQTVFTFGRPDREEQKRVSESMGAYWEFAGGLVARLKRAAESDPDAEGWLPHLIRAQREQPELVTDNVLQTTAMSGLLAAHETTTNASAEGIRTLLEHPDVWERLCREPEAIPRAVEECLRHGSTVVSWRRKATRDVEVGGVRIPAGARLMLMLASANRDEEVFEDPDTFDIDRGNANRHLAFGTGPHVCMGATLARREMRIFLEELTRRLPHMRLVEGQKFTYVPNTTHRGPDELWVEWDPQHNPVPADRLA